jgi:sterol desaturase/sphingolipid hydroxylase (fatty acid hydroxylase superfamily)
LAQFLHVTEEVLVVWLVFLAIHLLAYVLSVAIVVQSYRFFWDRGLSAHKIQQREASAADIRRDIRSSLGTALVFSMIYAAVYFGARAGIFKIHLGVAPLGWSYMIFSILAMIVAHDAHFYWTHRLLHMPRLARFHRTHHLSVTPTAYSCYAFGWVEATLHGLFQPLFLLIMPMQLPALVIAIGFMMVRNILGHSGVELFAHGSTRDRWYGWLVTNTDHDLHHSSYHYNFGFHFTWWDRLMGTAHPGTEAARTPRRVAEAAHAADAPVGYPAVADTAAAAAASS